ncbi:MAG: MFS transporter [Burkholderiaceae bacterium]
MAAIAATAAMPAFALVLLAAGGTFAVTLGARQSMALFIGALNSHTGLGLASISLAFAVGQLWWGITQPLAGIVADRVGTGRVLLAGIALVATGIAMIPAMSSTVGLILAVGILSAGGAGIAGPAVLMAATARLVPPEKRGIASGVVNAGGSFGQFVFAPLAQSLTAMAGWMVALQGMAAITLLALPAAWVLRTRPAAAASGEAAAPKAPAPSLRALFARAFALPSYRLLCAGFFVCGFHVAFIATHLPGVVASCQLPPEVGAWSLATIGLFNILGSLSIGWAIGHGGGRWRMKSMLSLIYATRALAVLVFVFAPKTPATLLVFAAVIGFTFLSTVPPTAGLVARFFGPAHMATLFGVVMLSHQIGGFLGSWLGGVAFQLTGSYDWMWWADIVLALGASLVHLPIDERPTVPAAQAA